MRAIRPTGGPTPVEAMESAVTPSGPNQADACSRGTAPTPVGAPERNRSDAGGRSLKRDRSDVGRCSLRGNRSDADRRSIRGETDRRSQRSRKWKPVRRGSTVRQGFGPTQTGGASMGTAPMRVDASARVNRSGAGRRLLPSLMSRCGAWARWLGPAGCSGQTSAGSSGARAGNSADARECGSKKRSSGHAASGRRRGAAPRERCRARGWRLTLAMEQRCRGDPAREGPWP